MSQSFQFISSELNYTVLFQCKITKEILVIKNIDKNGLIQGVEPIMNNYPHFIKVHNNHRDFLPFFRDLLCKVYNAQQYIYFRVPIVHVQEAVQEIRNAMQYYNLQDYEDFDDIVQEKDKAYEKTLKKSQKTQPNMSANSIIIEPDNTSQEALEPNVNLPEIEIVEDNDFQENVPNSSEYANNTFLDSQIDWETLEQIGITREKLEAKNLIDPLLKGYKTYSLFPVRLKYGNISCRTDVRLSFRHDLQGRVIINLQGIKKEPLLNLPFFGHEFSPEDKANLIKHGNMGRVVDLLQVHTGELLPSLISIDRATNDLIALHVDRVKIPDYIKGVKLSDFQKSELKQGKRIFATGLQSKKGDIFDAYLQYNADKKYVEFSFQKDHDSSSNFSSKTGVPTKFRGVELTLEQQETLEKGQFIYLEQLIDRNGCQYQGYIMYNKMNHSLQFFFEQPVIDID